MPTSPNGYSKMSYGGKSHQNTPHPSTLYIMKKYITDINTKWAMTYKSYKRATGKRKELLKQKLQELVILNARINQYNYERMDRHK